MNITYVVGARPNFMKIAPIMKAVSRGGTATQTLVHTGQHYDASMSEVFFSDLGMPRPDIHLGVGSGTHAEQTAKVMVGFEKICLERRPDLVVVAGDVNSTVACAIDAAKLNIPCAHVEAGLRSFDMTMPEEVNRVLTDRICDLLLTPSPDADENLLREGVSQTRIHRVGNVMIDTLLQHLPRARVTTVHDMLGVRQGAYAVLTLHRPSNVDNRRTFMSILDGIAAIQRDTRVVFVIHPRTRMRMREFGAADRIAAMPGVTLSEPLGYLDFLGLTSQAALILTDSGGLQEESTALGIPCLTLRENTERPVTVTHGTNTLVGTEAEVIIAAAGRALSSRSGGSSVPKLWDGKAADRIADTFARWWAGRTGRA